MTVDRHFLETVPAAILLAGILHLSFRRRVQYSWRWRLIIAAVLAIGTAPAVLPDMSGGYSVPHFFPMIMFFIPALSDPTFYSVAGIEGAFLFFILPFIVTLAFLSFLWFAFIRLMSKYERPAA